MSSETVRRPAPAPPRSPQTGRVVLGLLLVLLGAGWLLEAVGVLDVRWQAVLPAALLLIGLALLVTARRGYSGGLVTTGIVLSVVLIATSFVTIPFGGQLAGVGDVRHRPGTVADVGDGYGLGVGSLEVDLRELELPAGGATVEAGVAVGQLVVRLPAGATVTVAARSGMGEVQVEERSQSGLGVAVEERVPGDDPGAVLALELSVGMGRVEVRR